MAIACDATARDNVITFVGEDLNQRMEDSATMRLLTQGA